MGGLDPPGCDDDHLREKSEWKNTADQSSKEGHESPSISIEDVRICCTGDFPIVEAESLMARTTTLEQNEGEKYQSNDENEFDAREPELRFTVESHRKHVKPNDENKHDRNPHSMVNIGIPVIDHH